MNEAWSPGVLVRFFVSSEGILTVVSSGRSLVVYVHLMLDMPERVLSCDTTGC